MCRDLKWRKYSAATIDMALQCLRAVCFHGYKSTHVHTCRHTCMHPCNRTEASRGEATRGCPHGVQERVDTSCLEHAVFARQLAVSVSMQRGSKTMDAHFVVPCGHSLKQRLRVDLLMHPRIGIPKRLCLPGLSRHVQCGLLWHGSTGQAGDGVGKALMAYLHQVWPPVPSYRGLNVPAGRCPVVVASIEHQMSHSSTSPASTEMLMKRTVWCAKCSMLEFSA